MLIIGENINGTIPRIRDMILSRDGGALCEIAAAQEEAGAGIIDINVGTGEGTADDEAYSMQWLVELVRDTIKGKICIDSSDPSVLREGIRAAGESAGLINSVKATDRNIAEIMPLASEYGLPVVALAMDEEGIPEDSASRLKACEKIVAGAETFDIPRENIFFDPLVMPVSTDISQGKATLETLWGIKEEFPGAKSVLALSNVSFGLPRRTLINQAMMHMGQFLSVDALIINPLDKELMAAMKAGETVMGRDRHCRRYSRAVRQTKHIKEK